MSWPGHGVAPIRSHLSRLKAASTRSDDERVPSSGPEKRVYVRHGRRLPCVIQVEGERHRGFIANLSASGFYVQSSSKVEPPTPVLVTIEHDGRPIVVSGQVARRHQSHRAIAAVDRPGLGIQVHSAPESYYQLVLDLEAKGQGRA